jgi:5-methylcytosine-specific restriction endonuclease McrA
MMINKPCLVLSRAYEPLAITTARRGITLMVKESADCIENYGLIVHHSGMMLPSVIRLRQYRYIPVRVTILTRKNIYVRDRFRCQYCGKKSGAKVMIDGKMVTLHLTLDHVIPVSHGGRNVFENLVAACHVCNSLKADRTPEEAGMTLIRKPRPLTIHTSRGLLRSIGMMEDARWRPYLYP